MIIHALKDADVRAVQEREGSYYWSGCCENLFRKHGVIPWIAGGEAEPSALAVYPRGTFDGSAAAGALIEGPLSEDQLRAIGLNADAGTAQALRLFQDSERPLGPFEYPRPMLYPKDPKTGKAGAPYSYAHQDARYHRNTFTYQAFKISGTWKPVLFAARPQDDTLFPVAVHDGRRLVLGIPLLDLLCSMMAWPPLPDGYYCMESELPSSRLESWLIRMLRDVTIAGGHTWVRMPAWPQGHQWACTVRNDYDRPITDSQLRRWLDFYEAQGLRASWCFLEWNCPPHQAFLLGRGGHEIALHTGARTDSGFMTEVAAIQRETGVRPSGVTAHGGVCVGFIGDHQYARAEEAGMTWSETMGRTNRFPCRVVRIVNGLPIVSKLLLMATHSSLDAGTGPEQHYLDKVLLFRKAACAEGGHFVLMSHPDIHEAQAHEALTLNDFPPPWTATFKEVAQWTATSKYGISIACDRGKLSARFEQPLSHDGTIEFASAQARKAIKVPAGATSKDLG